MHIQFTRTFILGMRGLLQCLGRCRDHLPQDYISAALEFNMCQLYVTGYPLFDLTVSSRLFIVVLLSDI